jgi:thioredoxin reductase
MAQRNKVTIIGAGPAGLAAAMYLQRAELYPKVLEKDRLGGLLRNAYKIENYPGFPDGVKGTVLADLFVEQFHRLGLSVTHSVVKLVDSYKNFFFIETNRGRIISSAVIIAAGTIPRILEIPGSASIIGTRLFYEPQLLPLKENEKKKQILVIGGGDIAFDYTLTLLSWGHEVIIISRSKPTCLPFLYSLVNKTKTIILTRCIPEEVIVYPNNLHLRCRENNKYLELSADFILIACGREPNTTFLNPNLKKCFDNISDILNTSIPGLYFAGDIIRGANRQVGIAVGDGIHAAMLVERFLRNKMVE